MIRSIDDSNKYKQPELVSPTSTVLLLKRAHIYALLIFLKTKQIQFIVMLGINKITAAKLIVLWNLPALLILASAYEVGSTLLLN